MLASRLSLVFLLIACVLYPRALWAQQGLQPHIGYVFPAGGQKGTSFTVTLGGQNIDGIADVLVTGAGFSAKVVDQSKPLSNKEFNLLKDRLQELREKKRTARTAPKAAAGPDAGTPSPAKFTDQDQRLMDEILAKLSKYERKPANPNIAETATLQVTLAPDAAAGIRELRLLTKAGLTNPMIFQVGELPETSEAANDKTQGQREPSAIELPRTVNGQILPGTGDRYRFAAKRGQRIVIAVFARALIPYLADAVPGWFQATLALFDDAGKELAYDDDYRFDPDPVLCYTIPSDGFYQFEIRDSIFRGREDFVYRAFVGELPFVTGVFPLGARKETAASFKLQGWNLPGDRLSLARSEPGPCRIAVRSGAWIPNHAAIQIDTLPELAEQEPNDDLVHAEKISLPAVVDGRIGRPGDADLFAFEGKAGDILVAEVQARRLDSPLDSNLALLDSAGRRIAFNDDHDDKGDGLNTHHADSYLRVSLPSDGTYFAKLGDTQRNGGQAYAYRLILGPPRPDFALRVVPSSVNLRSGGTQPLTVYALRKDGFSGEISLSLKDAPPGFSLSGARIPAGQDCVRITLTAPRVVDARPLVLGFEGQAEIGGSAICHEAVPAEDMMQAFLYRHLVPMQRLVLAVAGKPLPKTAATIQTKGALEIPLGGKACVRISGLPPPNGAKRRLALNAPPDGVSLSEVKETWRGQTELTLTSDSTKTPAGSAGNLIVEVYLDREGSSSKKGARKQSTTPLDYLPAIPFRIVGP